MFSVLFISNRVKATAPERCALFCNIVESVGQSSRKIANFRNPGGQLCQRFAPFGAYVHGFLAPWKLFGRLWATKWTKSGTCCPSLPGLGEIWYSHWSHFGGHFDIFCTFLRTWDLLGSELLDLGASMHERAWKSGAQVEK